MAIEWIKKYKIDFREITFMGGTKCELGSSLEHEIFKDEKVANDRFTEILKTKRETYEIFHKGEIMFYRLYCGQKGVEVTLTEHYYDEDGSRFDSVEIHSFTYWDVKKRNL